MNRFSDRRPAAPPPDGLRDLHRRLAIVLSDLEFPAQRWQLIAAAEVYGSDTVTRAILERAPEQRYHTLPELVAVLGSLVRGRPVAPVPSAAGPVPPRVPHRHGIARTSPRAPLRRVVPGSPRPAA
jgi:hypothetical protein